MPINKKLEKEFEYYLSNQDELVKKFSGKYIVIKGQKVLGAYDNPTEALEKSSKDHKVGTFLIQYCSPGKNSYTQTFHSRVSFE